MPVAHRPHRKTRPGKGVCSRAASAVGWSIGPSPQTKPTRQGPTMPIGPSRHPNARTYPRPRTLSGICPRRGVRPAVQDARDGTRAWSADVHNSGQAGHGPRPTPSPSNTVDSGMAPPGMVGNCWMMRYRCPPTHDSGCNLPSIQDRRSGWFLDDLRVTGKSVTVCGTQESHRDSTQSGGFAPSPECGEPPVHIETDQRRGLAVLQQALHPRPHIGQPHVLYK